MYITLEVCRTPKTTEHGVQNCFNWKQLKS